MATNTIRWDVAERLIALIRTRKVTDGVTTSGDATVTSATAAFAATDVGRPISGTGIPASTTIATINSATSIELSQNATANGTGITLTIGQATLDGVQVEAGWPGDTLKSEAVWIDQLDGEVTIPVMTAGRKYRDDRFTVPFEVRVAGKASLDATMTRLAVIVAEIEDVLADDPGLDTLDGLISAEVSEERMTAGEIANTGWIGFAEIVVSCHARYE